MIGNLSVPQLNIPSITYGNVPPSGLQSRYSTHQLFSLGVILNLDKKNGSKTLGKETKTLFGSIGGSILVNSGKKLEKRYFYRKLS